MIPEKYKVQIISRAMRINNLEISCVRSHNLSLNSRDFFRIMANLGFINYKVQNFSPSLFNNQIVLNIMTNGLKISKLAAVYRRLFLKLGGFLTW